MRFNFSKALFWLGLAHTLLGAAIEHTKNHNTLTAIDTGIQDVEGLSGALGVIATPPAGGVAAAVAVTEDGAGKLGWLPSAKTADSAPAAAG